MHAAPEAHSTATVALSSPATSHSLPAAQTIVQTELSTHDRAQVASALHRLCACAGFVAGTEALCVDAVDLAFGRSPAVLIAKGVAVACRSAARRITADRRALLRSVAVELTATITEALDAAGGARALSSAFAVARAHARWVRRRGRATFPGLHAIREGDVVCRRWRSRFTGRRHAGRRRWRAVLTVAAGDAGQDSCDVQDSTDHPTSIGRRCRGCSRSSVRRSPRCRRCRRCRRRRRRCRRCRRRRRRCRRRCQHHRRTSR